MVAGKRDDFATLFNRTKNKCRNIDSMWVTTDKIDTLRVFWFEKHSDLYQDQSISEGGGIFSETFQIRTHLLRRYIHYVRMAMSPCHHCKQKIFRVCPPNSVFGKILNFRSSAPTKRGIAPIVKIDAGRLMFRFGG